MWLGFLLLAVAALADDVNKRRFDCHPDPGATQQNCEARGCIWKEYQTDDKFLPWCYMPDGIGYKVASVQGSTYNLQKNNGPKSPFDVDIQQIQMTVKAIDSVLNVKIGVNGRYEPPISLPQQTVASSDSLSIFVNSSADPFYFQVKRSSSQRVLFDTSIGGLIFADRFIQIATYLPSNRMYGWGENIHKTIHHDLTRYLRWGMFARDEPPDSLNLDTKNLYGVHPFYMVLEPDGKAHGVFIFNSNAQDLLTYPAPALAYRTTGGNLDMYFFPGPTPEEVTRQYINFIGKPFLPAYWALGFQLCRYGYKNLDEAKSVIASVVSANIPFDVAMFDIDYMDRYKDFTIGSNWADLPAYVDQLHSWGMKNILIWDPAIEVDYDSYQRAKDSGARFIEWETSSQVQNSINDLYPLTKGTKAMLGVVWPDKHVAFPDFLDPTGKTTAWWAAEFKRFHDIVKFDGSWIDMNEPSVFGTNEKDPWYFDNPDHPDDPPLFCPTTGDDAYWENAPYLSQGVYQYGQGSYLYSKTLCMLGMTVNRTQRFFNTKNLYGWSESKSTMTALAAATGKRGAIISRSTFPSSGAFAGHWLGDNTARWEDLQTSVIGAQEFNLFGIPYVGSDVCGFIDTTTEELCLRWQQMGSFHSFYRNHNNNGSPPQHPTVWKSVADATRKANYFRYQHLPYLFSLHFASSLYGTPVIRPVFFQYPTDEYAPTLSYQFMWGPSILVAPVVYQGATSVHVYLPSDTWYSLYDYNQYQQVSPGFNEYPAPWTSNIPAFIRAGSIIPRQTADNTATATHKNPFGLLITAGTTISLFATGELYFDDGDSLPPADLTQHNYYHINITFLQSPISGSILFEVDHSATFSLPKVNEVIIAGYPNAVDFTSFTINGQKTNVNVQTSNYNAIQKLLTIRTTNFIDLNQSKTIVVKWAVAKSVSPKDVYSVVS